MGRWPATPVRDAAPSGSPSGSTRWARWPWSSCAKFDPGPLPLSPPFQLDTNFVFHYISVMKNVTITLDEEVVVWAKICAAKQETSLSRLVGEMLKEKNVSGKTLSGRHAAFSFPNTPFAKETRNRFSRSERSSWAIRFSLTPKKEFGQANNDSMILEYEEDDMDKEEKLLIWIQKLKRGESKREKIDMHGG